jgi:hypothetical protein
VSWKRGLFRVWVVSSVIWLMFIGWLAYSARSAASLQQACFDARIAKADSDPYDCFDDPYLFSDLIPLSSHVAQWVLIVIGPIIGTLLLGYVIAWVIAGFKRA